MGTDPEVSPQIRPGRSLGEQRIMVTRDPLTRRPDRIDQLGDARAAIRLTAAKRMVCG
jgi:hypothetical protein